MCQALLVLLAVQGAGPAPVRNLGFAGDLHPPRRSFGIRQRHLPRAPVAIGDEPAERRPVRAGRASNGSDRVSVADEKPSLEFRRAPSDSTYRQVIYRTRGRGDLTGLILLGVLGVGAIAILVVLVRLAMRKPLQRYQLHQIGDRVAELLRRGT
jgi:hypothetical protein